MPAVAAGYLRRGRGKLSVLGDKPLDRRETVVTSVNVEHVKWQRVLHPGDRVDEDSGRRADVGVGEECEPLTDRLLVNRCVFEATAAIFFSDYWDLSIKR